MTVDVLNLEEGSPPAHVPTICPHPGRKGDSNLDSPSVAQSDLVPTVSLFNSCRSGRHIIKWILYSSGNGGTEGPVHFTKYQGVCKSGLICPVGKHFGPCVIVWILTKSTIDQKESGIGIPEFYSLEVTFSHWISLVITASL